MPEPLPPTGPGVSRQGNVAPALGSCEPEPSNLEGLPRWDRGWGQTLSGTASRAPTPAPRSHPALSRTSTGIEAHLLLGPERAWTEVAPPHNTASCISNDLGNPFIIGGMVEKLSEPDRKTEQEVGEAGAGYSGFSQ